MRHHLSIFGSIFITIALVSNAPVWAEDPSTEDLAAKVEQLQQEVAELKAGSGEKASRSEQSWLQETFDKVDIHGYVAQGFLYSNRHNYLFSETEEGEFQFNEMAINFYTELTPKLSVAVQLYSRDLGAVGNNAIQLDYAFGDYHYRDELGFRAGRIRIPWGLYGEFRDIDSARTSIIMPQNIYGENQRDVAYGMLGFAVYGMLPLGGAGSLEYQAQVGSNTVDDQNSAIGGISWGSDYTDPDWRSDHDRLTTARVIWNTPVEGLRLGASHFTINEVSFTSTTTDDPFLVDVQDIAPGSEYVLTLSDIGWTIASVEYTTGNLVLAAEHVWFSNTMDDSIFGEFGETQGDGYYLSASYRFSDLFSLGTYYSTYWGNKEDRKGEGNALYGWPDHYAWSKDLALSLRFDLHKGFIFKLEGHYMDGTANLNSNFNDFATTEKNAFLFAAKASYTF